jgi:hypothetical protein
MCRVEILGIIDKKDVHTLPIPNILKEYLTYPGEVDYVIESESDAEEDYEDDDDDESDDGDSDEANGNGGGGGVH